MQFWIFDGAPEDSNTGHAIGPFESSDAAITHTTEF